MDAIPNSNYPRRHPLPHRRDYALKADVEQVTKMPPDVGKVYGSLVSDVDSDGNEIAGIALPEVAVPLAAYTGWNLRHPEIGGETQPLMFAGGTIPFAKNADERAASGDPRLSIAERYTSRDDYLARVRAAAEGLVSERLLLAEDVERCVERAGLLWDWFG